MFSGAKAVELGLADQTGLLADAIDDARALAKAPNASAVHVHAAVRVRRVDLRRDVDAGPAVQGASRWPCRRRPSPLPAGFYYLWRP